MNARLRTAVFAFVAGGAALIAGAPGSAARAPGDAARAPEPRPTFAIALPPYPFSFPRDAGSHPRYQTEWWYYTGHLRTAAGRRFGYELTFFRFGLRPGAGGPLPGQSRWRGAQLYPAHFALTDVDGNRFVHVERLARAALGMGRAATTGLDVAVDDWFVRSVPRAGVPADRFPMTLHAADTSGSAPVALDLEQSPEKPPAIHGTDGVSKKAACRSCASHYYSYTRLRSSGSVTYGGARMPVTGLSWMDHEFGSSQLEAGQQGWDWFSIQLADRREVMLYRLRRRDGGVTPESSGSIVDPAGHVRHLALDRFSIESTGRWTSPHDGAIYPSGWRVRIPSAGLDLVVTPQVLDQELAAAVGGSYWEGAVDVRDAGGRSAGDGYVELTGYAGGIAL